MTCEGNKERETKEPSLRIKSQGGNGGTSSKVRLLCFILKQSSLIGCFIDSVNDYSDYQWAFCNSGSRDQLTVYTKIVCFWKILLAETERAY